ncbi:hypothetical protein MW344_005017 [Vibrio parahaemolyticus]|nr:hypothetical protein [Vibrio parahaemolyticus]
MIDKGIDKQEESTDYSALKKENFELKVILAAMSIAFMSVVIVGGVLTMNVVADELFPYEGSKEIQTDLLTLEEFKGKGGSDE